MHRLSVCCAAVVAAVALYGCDCGNGSNTDGGSGGGGAVGGGTGGGSSGGGTGGGSVGGGTGGGSVGGGGGSVGGGGGSTGGGAGGGGGGAGGGAGGGSGLPCALDGGSCPTNEYCDVPGCTGPGTCKPVLPKASEQSSKSPVCGCDDVVYWNSSVAQSHGTSVRNTGTCAQGSICGGLAGFQCPTDTYCNYEVLTSSDCFISDISGTCWAVPETCPMVVIGPVNRACNASTCTEECALIKSQGVWYPDNTCPQ